MVSSVFKVPKWVLRCLSSSIFSNKAALTLYAVFLKPGRPNTLWVEYKPTHCSLLVYWCNFNIHLLPPCPLLIFHPSARNLSNILIIMGNTLKPSLPENHLSHPPVRCMLSSLFWPDLPAKLQSLHPVRESYPLAQRLCTRFFEGTTKYLPTFPLGGALFIKIQPSCSVTCESESISLQRRARRFLLPSRLKHPLFLPLSSPHCTCIASLPFPLSHGCVWL